MKLSIKIVASIFLVLFVLSCSTKKDAFLNRSYHSVTTKYNVLFNGNEAFKIGLNQLNESYDDNYWKTLPIEPLKVDKLTIPGIKTVKDNSPKEFEKAEEKAVKAIQKHSMLIARQERNKQIDDAYLLLGKSRYYSKRFVPALEAFNYVIINYPKANLINETKIWQAKTHIRLQNPEQAIYNLKMLLQGKDLPDEIRESVHTAMAMAYTEIDSIHKVIKHLNKSVITTKNKDQAARNLFILGQFYRDNKVLDSSNFAFQKVVNLKKAPYKYKIHAQLEIAKNASDSNEKLVAIDELNKLAKNRDNKPYLDEIYYQLGQIEKENNTEIALQHFKKSVTTSLVDNYQKELSYQAIGNLYFDKAEFITAGAYYDSILQISKDENSKRIRRLKRKRKNLNEVINFETIAKTNDSILRIVGMSDEEQKDYFTEYIVKLKKDEEKIQLSVNTGSSIVNKNKTSKQSTGGKWYFYNNQTVGFGQQEFKRVWGNRPLEDNWRLSDKNILNVDVNAVVNTSKIVSNEEKYDVNYYLKSLPSKSKQIDSISSERNNAYFRLGVIYKEQFNETNLAISKLETLLAFEPDKNLELPAKYHLYKIYSGLNNEKAAELKNDIVSNFAASNYAKIIQNPNQILSKKDDENSPEKYYTEVFYEYKDAKYQSVIDKAKQAIATYDGNAIVPKFELLKAYAVGKKDGVDAFKAALEFVAINYPNTEEGKKAQEVIITIQAKM